MSVSLEIDVAESFGIHLDAAITRFGYLHPVWLISAKPTKVTITLPSAGDEAIARREFNYALYRERIRSEGAPLRELLLKSVMT
jgi:hypothetical protein